MQEQHLIIGKHAAIRILATRPDHVQSVTLQEQENTRLATAKQLAQQHHIPIHIKGRKALDEWVGKKHQGIVLTCKKWFYFNEKDIPYLITQSQTTPLVLAFDGIQDPHNLGACLRSAYAFGVDWVILPKHNNCLMTAVVQKTSAGTAHLMPMVLATNLRQTLEQLKKEGFWVVGAIKDAKQTVAEVPFNDPTVLVIGSEQKGLRRLTEATCDVHVRIPMSTQLDSLNASVACGVLLYEITKK
jgi:23S rRNA (guanosine2251-2'-O)-methyltransferase